MKGDREKYLGAGFDGYVSKPVNPQELKAVIDSRTTGDSSMASSNKVTAKPLAVLNLSEALARVEGNRKLLAKVARVFLEIYPKLLEESQTAVARADCDLLARAARTIASSAGQIGAGRVRAAAKKLEALSRQGDLSDAPDALNKLDSEIRLVESAIVEPSNPDYSWLRNEA
jgi:HPt (histidine-containing phosphotransfer) domain-containing protein